ncbi:MAG: glycosyltransferase [Acidobacteria bacterium]|nr:glycosyltransferase [Acidobacteriota bacterium]
MSASSGQPVRVLLIAPSSDILGGQSVQASRILGNLAREPLVKATFLPMNPRLGPLQFLKKIKFVRTAATVFAFLVRLLWLVPRNDIVHVFAAAYFSFVWAPAPAILVGKLFGKKVILNYRDGQAEDHLRNWPIAFRIIQMADVIVAPSGYLVDVFAKFGLKARSIFNIIDPSPFLYRERPKPRPIFLHNRILEPLYNIQCTLRAFQRIQQRYPDATLTLAHEGPSWQELEEYAQGLGLRNTKFVGKVPHRQIAALYDSADIYLTSPNLDCMPGSLLECYSSGLPIVATDAGGIPYILFDEATGLLVPKDDDEAMANAAFRLLEEEGLALRLTRAGRAELDRYSWDKNVRNLWVGLYAELMGRPEVAQ